MSSSHRRGLYVAIAILASAFVGVWIWSWARGSGARTERGEQRHRDDAHETSAVSLHDASVARGEVAGVDAGIEETDLAPVRLSAPRVERDPAVRAGVLEGRVIAFASGRGVPRAELSFEHGGSTVSVRANASGAFRFEAREEGTYVLALATADGFLPFAPEWGHSPIRWEARAGVRLSGVVVTLVDAVEYVATVSAEDGTAVAGAEVHVFGVERGERALAPLASRFVTDARGEARFVAPDFAVLEASHAAHGRGRARIDSAAQVTHRVAIRLLRDPSFTGGLRIAGRVIDTGGAPIEGALVTARFRSRPSSREGELHPFLEATSDAEGAFVLEGADAGAYRVGASAPDFIGAFVDPVRAGASDVTLRLDRGARLRVRVRDGASGEPVAAVTVVVTRSTGPLTEETIAVESAYDDQGEVEVAGLPSIAVHVAAVAPGYAPSSPVDVRVRDGASVEVRLDRGGSIAGRVVSSAGRALAGARVTLEGRLGSGSSAVPLEASVLSGEDGSFTMTGVPAGLRSIVVWAAEHHGRLRGSIDVVAGQTSDLGTIDLAPVEDGEEPRLEMAGIGAVLSAEGDALVIGRVVEGGGAAEIGLVPGDAIVEIEGTPAVTLGFEGAIQRIRGPEGTVVRMRVRRASGGVESLAVPRRRIRA